MTNRFPLIVNPDTQEIQELKSNDNLNLTGNGIFVNGSSGLNGQVLTSNGTSVEWRTVSGGGSGGGGATTLNQLDDVSLSLPLVGQVLKYNGTLWTNADDETGGLNLNDLTDVTLTNKVNNQLLRYDGATQQWYNWTPNYLTSETSHADVLVDADFTSTGLMRRGNNAGVYSVITDNSTNWNTAYSWGNHALAGYLTTIGSINNATDVTINAAANNQLLRYNGTTSQWENWSPNYLSSYTETDPVFSNHPAFGVSTALITQWGAAYNWGNHADAGYFTAVTLKANADLNALKNVNINTNTLVTGNVLKWNGTNWTNLDDLSEGGNLNALSDVTITTPTTNQLLRYNGTEWVNWSPNFLTSIGSIDNASDVAITNAQLNQQLKWDGTNWINFTPSAPIVNLDGLTDVSILNPQTGQTLKYNGVDWVNGVDTSGISGPETTLDNAIARWSGVIGGITKNSSVTISDAGAILAPQAGSCIPFYFATAATFPDYTVYRGALAYAQDVNRVYVANTTGWGGLVNVNDSIDVLSDVAVSNPSNNQLLKYNSTTSQWINWTPNYLTAETDPIFVSSSAYSITNAQKTNWDTAYGWGNHASAGYLTSLPSRQTAQVTTASLAAAPVAGSEGGSATATLVAAKAYSLFKIQTSSPAWVILYTDSTSRSNDSTRVINADPLPGNGIIAEVITTSSALTQIISPGTIGWNNDATPSTNVYAKIVNTNTSLTAITVTITYLKLEG